MPGVAFCILIALLEYDEASVHQMSASSGYDVGKYIKVVNRMIMLGWVLKVWNGRWSITERGKIVAAIEVGRRSRSVRSRAKGEKMKKMTVRRFYDISDVLSGTDAALTG